MMGLSLCRRNNQHGELSPQPSRDFNYLASDRPRNLPCIDLTTGDCWVIIADDVFRFILEIMVRLSDAPLKRAVFNRAINDVVSGLDNHAGASRTEGQAKWFVAVGLVTISTANMFWACTLEIVEGLVIVAGEKYRAPF